MSAVPAGYKQTEVGVIPGDWKVTTLGDICEFENGDRSSNYPSGDDFTTSGIPFVNAGHVGDGKIAFSAMDYITPGSFTRLTRGKIKCGDILYCLRGSLGKFGIADDDFGEGAIASSLVIVRPKKSIALRHYLLCYFGSDLCAKMIETWAGGAAQPNLGVQDLARFALAVPPMPAEQDAIAEALSDADALIESLKQLLTKKRHLKQAAMQELLTGKKRLPGFSGEWVVKRLRELANIQRGASPRPIDSPIWFDEKSAVGWVRISDVTKSGMYLLDTTQRLSALGILHSRPVCRGSLIMSICATVGRPVITKIDTCIHDGFVVFDNLRTTQHFMYYVLQSIEDDWSRHGQTGSQMNLNTTLINSTEVSMPPTIEEQAAIADTLSDMDAELADLEAQLDKSRAIKQGMMQKLLTGEIRLI